MNKHRENGGEWFAEPEETAKIEHAKKTLAEYRKIEPNSDWHLEARGETTDWHRWVE